MNTADIKNFIYKRKLVATLLGISVVLLALVIVFVQSGGSSINSFDECVKAGNPVMDTYPEQCAADGKIFIKSQPPAQLTN